MHFQGELWGELWVTDEQAVSISQRMQPCLGLADGWLRGGMGNGANSMGKKALTDVFVVPLFKAHLLLWVRRKLEMAKHVKPGAARLSSSCPLPLPPILRHTESQVHVHSLKGFTSFLD